MSKPNWSATDAPTPIVDGPTCFAFAVAALALTAFASRTRSLPVNVTAAPAPAPIEMIVSSDAMSSANAPATPRSVAPAPEIASARNVFVSGLSVGESAVDVCSDR